MIEGRHLLDSDNIRKPISQGRDHQCQLSLPSAANQTPILERDPTSRPDDHTKQKHQSSDNAATHRQLTAIRGHKSLLKTVKCMQ